jgi:hypothetical protein
LIYLIKCIWRPDWAPGAKMPNFCRMSTLTLACYPFVARDASVGVGALG